MRAALQRGDVEGAAVLAEQLRGLRADYQAARLRLTEAERSERDRSWRPPYAQHVLGVWTARRFEAGLPVPQTIRCVCESCGTVWETVCTSGLVRARVQAFAYEHLHRDALDVRGHEA